MSPPSSSAGERPAAWREGALEGDDSLYAGRERSDDDRDYPTLTYEVTGRVARLTFNRPERGNTITTDTPGDLAHAVERADLDPRVHVILLSGRGKGFCGGYDLTVFAENAFAPPGERRRHRYRARPGRPDQEPRSREHLGPDGRLRDDEPLQPRVRVACCTRTSPPWRSCTASPSPAGRTSRCTPTRSSAPTTSASATRRPASGASRRPGCGPTGSATTRQAAALHRRADRRPHAADWGLAVESWPADELDERTEALVEKIAPIPVNQLMMVKLALNSALLAQGVATSGMVSTVFDGVSRHTREGYAFQQRAATVGFREAVRERDEAFGDDKGSRAYSGRTPTGSRPARPRARSNVDSASSTATTGPKRLSGTGSLRLSTRKPCTTATVASSGS